MRPRSAASCRTSSWCMQMTFDVNDVLKLTKTVSSPIFYTSYPVDPTAQFRSPAIANTVGGGSWISEFEVINGIDSRLFGVLGRYTHYSLSGYINKNFVRDLRAKGYATAVYAPHTGDFFNYGPGYKSYGYDKYFGPYDMGLSEATDVEIVTKALKVDPPAETCRSTGISCSLRTTRHPCLPHYDSDIEAVSLAGNPSPAQTARFGPISRG